MDSMILIKLSRVKVVNTWYLTWLVAKKCHDWVTLIQQGAEQGDPEHGQGVGESGAEEESNDDGGNCDDDDVTSDSSQDSPQIEELRTDSEPFLPQLFGLIEDPGVIRINNVDYGDVYESDYDEIISFKQSRSFIGHIYLFNKNSKSRSGLLRFSKSLNDVSQEYEETWPYCINLFRWQTRPFLKYFSIKKYL